MLDAPRALAAYGYPIELPSSGHRNPTNSKYYDPYSPGARGAPRIALTACRGIISYTSYSRTNDCIYNGYDNNLEHNAMNNKNTITHMDAHNTQY